MTLKEKLKTGFSINTDGEAGRFANQCEKIADDYAIEFAEWIDDFYYQHDVQKNKYARSRQDFIDGEVFRIKQLLEIFKKEKGL